MLSLDVKKELLNGTVIPAHPLALTENRQLDEASQRALTRYYIDAGVGGIAVGVHTTQFEIRDPNFNLYEKVLSLAMEEVEKANIADTFIKIAGICGRTEQAKREAEYAIETGYDLGLVSLGGLNDLTEEQLLTHIKRIADIIPVFGFYLQPLVGGRVLSYEFWKTFADIQNVYAVKIAPFNRYQAFDVVRAVCHSNRNEEIALYTGNDDNIVSDLLTTYQISVGDKKINKKIVGGLLGHWSVWTKRVVDIFKEIKAGQNKEFIPSDLLTLGQQITDANAAFFDPSHDFKGSIAGINEVLARQGLLKGNWCLLEKEKLSPNQMEEIDRVYEQYPHLHDDEFVKSNIEKWFA
ncbi:dihydrodipicolinate synthase family protein [Lederbergia panacisoli]|uniref:dihydrodipicolinate synthase family protein n=1 Tax=Lederbergia panacisoli TaxID=1255251 RepID=UPI00214C1941|nr:dihydrodipicolinate synthase family protein [Lederbergia panacisoli]MCR2822059.1 dihydrodipicolinate synthase family protein [Lederbergia panacisoli]